MLNFFFSPVRRFRGQHQFADVLMGDGTLGVVQPRACRLKKPSIFSLTHPPSAGHALLFIEPVTAIARLSSDSPTRKPLTFRWNWRCRRPLHRNFARKPGGGDLNAVRQYVPRRKRIESTCLSWILPDLASRSMLMILPLPTHLGGDAGRIPKAYRPTWSRPPLARPTCPPSRDQERPRGTIPAIYLVEQISFASPALFSICA
jgi:hypothetical protein